MKILIACQQSQAVAKEFRKRGHEAFSCDLIPCSGGHPEWHIVDDARDVAYSEDWDMLIGFPPCTFLSRAGAVHLHKSEGIDMDRYAKGLDARQFFMDLYNSPIEHVALENPTPLKIFELPDPDQVVQPFMFGHPYTKRTLLWLKNLPPVQPTAIVEPMGSWVAKHRSKKMRSKTFPGLASAMAEQWSGLGPITHIPEFDLNEMIRSKK